MDDCGKTDGKVKNIKVVCFGGIKYLTDDYSISDHDRIIPCYIILGEVLKIWLD